MRRLEEQFKVHISSRREGVFVVSGEEANVTQCAGEIADMLGFSSASHFSRVFRQRFGKTPKEFTQ